MEAMRTSQLIAPAFALAALCLSSTAYAGDPEPGSAEVEAGNAEDAEKAVEASEPVTLENEVAAGAEASVAVGSSGGIERGGRLGIGAARTLAGINGINIRYFIVDSFHIGVNLGAATFSYRYPDPTNDPADCADQTDPACVKKVRTVAYIGASLEGIYWVQGKPAGAMPVRADFGVGGRLGFQHIVNSTDIPNNLDDPLQLTAEIPLMLAVNIGQNFSIIPEFGVVFRWNPGTRLVNTDGDFDSNPGFNDPNGRLPPGEATGPGFGWELGDHVGLFGGASLMYTF